MLRSPDLSPRRLSDISPQLRQLNYLVVDDCIKEELKPSKSVEDLTGTCPGGLTSIEERILRITGYYGYYPWSLRCTIWMPVLNATQGNVPVHCEGVTLYPDRMQLLIASRAFG